MSLSLPAFEAGASPLSQPTRPAARPQSTPRLVLLAIVHNAGPPLVDCVASWFATLPPLAEVVLVDNASSDAAIDEVAARFPAVRILRSESNLGYAGGATWGAQWVLEQHPQLAYLGVINDDVWIEAGALSRLVDALDARPEWGIVQPRLMLAEAPGHINTVGLD